MTGRDATRLVVPSGRRAWLLEELLRLSADPHGVAAAWEGVRGSGSAVPIRPHEPRCALGNRNGHGARCTCWLRSLDELERRLRELQNTDRPAWYAVMHRYVYATRQPRLVTVKNGRPMLELNQAPVGLVNRADLNKRGDGRSRMLVETWRHGLNPEFTWKGLGWLSEHFRGPLELPLEMLHDHERTAA